MLKELDIETGFYTPILGVHEVITLPFHVSGQLFIRDITISK